MEESTNIDKEQKNKNKIGFTKLITIGFVALMIFSLGVGVGSGRVNIGPDAALRSGVSKDLPADLDYSSVEQVYDSLRANYDGELKGEELLDGLKEGLAKSTGDPYTEYLNPTAAKEFDEDLNGSFSGIGAELSKDKELIVIISPISGFPAEKAGLRPKDVIAEINGESAYDLSVSEAVKKIRGEVGTKVKLKVVRDGSEQLDFEITREKITIPSVTSEILPDNIGYLKVSRFAEDTSALSREAAVKFKNANVKGVILDVRGDPGGLLESSVDLASLWLENGKNVLQEKRGDVVVKTYNAKGTPTLKGIPTVVLINEGSASASEILAGALRDNNAATLIGQKTFGKGSVQSLVRLGDDSVLKITIARWFTPSGKNIDKEGIEPDQKVERTDEDFKNNKDPQRDAALNFLKK
ncbi:S41 family peptidase [Candidatus Saccharibacteria bacterium]|nr:S41 family peptidase [Candidatus Saccharibacteria bacterium]